MHQASIAQGDGDPTPRFFPPNAQLIGYIVAQPNRLPHLRLSDRGLCPFCKGERRIVEDGHVIACPDCRGQGVELRREDHFALDDDDSLTETDIGRENPY